MLYTLFGSIRRLLKTRNIISGNSGGFPIRGVRKMANKTIDLGKSVQSPIEAVRLQTI